MYRFVRFFALACACLVSAVGAARADDPYTVRNIHVDASAVSASEAYNAGIAQGRPRAWQTVYRRLTRQQDWAKQPPLDDLGIQRLIKNYTITNERRSTTRYTGDVTYIFNPDQVRRVLRTTGVAYADAQAKRILIIPMAPGYVKGSGWVAVWNNPKLLNGSVPLVLPIGDAADMAVLGRLNFENANWNNVAGLAARMQANEVALLQLSGTSVRIHHLAQTPISGGAQTDIPVPGGGLSVAAGVTVSALEDYWKTRTAVDFSKRLRTTVTAHFDSLSDWATLLSALQAVPTVTTVEVVAINYGEARLGVVYAGSLDQVHDSLANTKVALNQDDGAWSLSIMPPARTP